MTGYGCCEGSDPDVDVQAMRTSVGAADGGCAYLPEMQVSAMGRPEEAKHVDRERPVLFAPTAL